MRGIKHFRYRVPKSGAVLLGTRKKQIQKTIEKYNDHNGADVKIPLKRKIERIGCATIQCAVEFTHMDSGLPVVEIPVKNRAFVEVHANALTYIRDTVRDYRKFKEGSLYKFERGMLPATFLPEYVLWELHEHDWLQHEQDVREQLELRDRLLPARDDLEKKMMASKEFFPAGMPEKIMDAFRKVDRREFLPAFSKHVAYFDKPALVYHGDIGESWQTCSQPSTIAYMHHLLEPEEGINVLEVGSGSGYSAAVTAYLIGRNGHLTTVERIPRLAEFARQNLGRHLGLEERAGRVEAVKGDGSAGYEENAPYDRICLTAGMNAKVFDYRIFCPQLTEGGILLAPQAAGPMIKYRRKNGEMVEEGRYSDMRFVSLRGKNS